MSEHRTILTLTEALLSDSPGSESLLECVIKYTHQKENGYLFTILATEQPLFIPTSNIINHESVMCGTVYKFMGYFADSQVIGLEKNI